MDVDGNFVGEICHIEAAQTGGERFNDKQTNEDRRAFENLMLMCHEHHVVTDNVDNYSPDRLRLIKSAHEKKVFDFLEGMTLQIYDTTKQSDEKLPSTLEIFGYKRLSDAESAENLRIVLTLISELKNVPKTARQLLVIAVRRGNTDRTRYEVSLDDLEAASNLTNPEFRKWWMILDHNHIVRDGGENDNGQKMGMLILPISGWQIWDDFRNFENSGKLSLEELLVDLNFSLLDQDP